MVTYISGNLPGLEVISEEVVLIVGEVEHSLEGRSSWVLRVIAHRSSSLAALVLEGGHSLSQVLEGGSTELSIPSDIQEEIRLHIGTAVLSVVEVDVVGQTDVGVEHEHGQGAVFVDVASSLPLHSGDAQVLVDHLLSLPAVLDHGLVEVVVESGLVVHVTPESSLAGDVDVGSSQGVGSDDGGDHSPFKLRVTDGPVEVSSEDIEDGPGADFSEAAGVGTGKFVLVLFACAGGLPAELELSLELAQQEVGVESVLSGVVGGQSAHDGLRHDDREVSQRGQVAAPIVGLEDIESLETGLQTNVGGVEQVDTAVSSSEGLAVGVHPEVHEVVAGESDEASSESGSGLGVLGVLGLVG